MNSGNVRAEQWNGFEGVRLENAGFSALVLPECAGKIVELTVRSDGRQWLWRNPAIPVRLPRFGADYIHEFDSGGWDEIFPTVAPCVIETKGRRLTLPDHGELVGLRWRAVELEADGREARLGLEAFAPLTRCLFRRRIVCPLDAARMRMEYALIHQGEADAPWLWSAHPLLRPEGGLRIELPEGAEMTLWELEEGRLVRRGLFAWPWAEIGGARRDLSRLSSEAEARERPLAAKVFGRWPEEGARLVLANGHGFRVQAEGVDWLGLWMNLCGWRGAGPAPYYNLGFEPTAAPFDSLTEALAAGAARRIRPGERIRWSVTLTAF